MLKNRFLDSDSGNNTPTRSSRGNLTTMGNVETETNNKIFNYAYRTPDPYNQGTYKNKSLYLYSERRSHNPSPYRDISIDSSQQDIFVNNNGQEDTLKRIKKYYGKGTAEANHISSQSVQASARDSYIENPIVNNEPNNNEANVTNNNEVGNNSSSNTPYFSNSRTNVNEFDDEDKKSSILKKSRPKPIVVKEVRTETKEVITKTPQPHNDEKDICCADGCVIF
jgi:hypothetical protein